MIDATITYVLESKRKDDTGRSLVKIRLTYLREAVLLSLPEPIRLLPSEWTDLQAYHIYKDTDGRKAKVIEKWGNLKKIYSLLYGVGNELERAKQIAGMKEVFTIDDFRLYYNDRDSMYEKEKVPCIFKITQSYINKLQMLEQEGSAGLYRNMLVSLSNFHTQHTLPPSLVTVEFLYRYEAYMKAEGNSQTTIGIYCRHLRAMVNEAISEGLLSKDAYPFGKRGYRIPQGSNPKKALSRLDIEKILAYKEPMDDFKQRSYDLWVFSYLSNGMNISDVCHLKWKHVSEADNKITFTRNKTRNTQKSNQKTIVAYLFEQSHAIIARYARKRDKESYVFGLIDDTMDAKQKKATTRQIIKVTNKWMRRIAQEVGVGADITTMTARHSFATILMRSSAPVAFISQALGHSSIQTTENYLGSFEDDSARDILSELIQKRKPAK